MTAPSEKIHYSAQESSVESIPGDENAPIRPIDPEVLRRATLKIDLYLVPIIAMFCELLSYLPLTYLSSPFPDLLSFLVSTPAVVHP